MIEKVNMQEGERISKKNRLKSLIEQTSVFDIDSALFPAKYEIEKRKLIENLYLYVLEVYKNNRLLLFDGNYEEYGLEIVNTARNCIENYDDTKAASFLTYFMSAWKLECQRSRNKKTIREKKGYFSIPERDMRLLVNLEKYLHSKGIYLSSISHAEMVAEQLGVSEDKAKDIIRLYNLSPENIYINDEGEEIDPVARIPDEKSAFESKIIDAETWNEWMTKIDKAINQLKKRPQQCALDVLTCIIAEVFLELDETYSYDYSFINFMLFQSIIKNNEIPQMKEIASEHHVSPQYLAVTYKRMINMVKIKINECEDNLIMDNQQK